MKNHILSIAAILLLTGNIAAFLPHHSSHFRHVALMAVELKPEPEGGEELTPVKTIEGSRMKNMGEASGIQSDEGTVFSFWFQATANGALVKDLNTQVLKDAKKKANFPGFRKGQVPPYAMPQIRGFAVQEAIVQTAKSAIDAYGLKSIKGEKGNLEVLEEVADLAKTYKDGDIQFTATINAVFDPELAQVTEVPTEESESATIDVEAEAM